MQKLVSPGGTVFLKIAWFSLNQVSLENFGVRVPLRFQMHTHFQFSLDFGILTLELRAIDLSPKPGEGLSFLTLYWWEEPQFMTIQKFIPGLGIRGAHWCPVLLPFILGSPSLSTGKGWILHSDSELPCYNSNVPGSSASLTPIQCSFRDWIGLMCCSWGKYMGFSNNSVILLL